MSRERGLGTLPPCIPFSTVVEVELDNPEPLCSKGRGQKSFTCPITEQDAARCINMVRGTPDVRVPQA